MRANEYEVLRHAINEGTAFGIRRAFKHRDDAPSDEAVEALKDALESELLNAITTWFTLDAEREVSE